MLELKMFDMDRDRSRAHLNMLIRALVIGLSFSAVGLITKGQPPLLLTALRFAIAAIVMLPIVWRTADRLPGPAEIALYSILGLSQAAFFGAMFWAAYRTTALSMAALSVSVPLLAYYLGRAFGVEPPRGRLVGILALGATGALALAWAQADEGRSGVHLGTADAVYFAGCLGLALYFVSSKWGLSRRWLPQGAAIRTFWSLVLGAVLIGALGLMAEKPQLLAKLTLTDALLLAYLGVFSTSMSSWLMQRATAALTPGEMTAYAYVPPLVSMLVLFTTEPQSISWRWLPGALLVVLAITLLVRLDADRKSGSARIGHAAESTRRSISTGV